MSGVEVPGGVARHRFELRSREQIVPGYLWTATGGHGRRPLVLLGHGATASKDTPPGHRARRAARRGAGLRSGRYRLSESRRAAP